MKTWLIVIHSPSFASATRFARKSSTSWMVSNSGIGRSNSVIAAPVGCVCESISPAVAVDSDPTMTASMRRIMKMMAKEGSSTPGLDAKPDLEINPDHEVMVKLNVARQADAALAGEVAAQILDNALIAAGLMEDPRAMLGRINSLLERVLTK